MNKINGMLTQNGAEGRTYYPHERPQGLMPKSDFPDRDELETGEPPSHFKDRELAGEFNEDEFLHEIDAGITPELRIEASDFASELTDSSLTTEQLEKVFAYALSQLAHSQEKDASRRLELARQATEYMIEKILGTDQEQEPEPETTETTDASMSSRLPHRAFNRANLSRGMGRTKRNLGQKPLTKNKHK